MGATISWVVRRLEIHDFCSPFENIKFSLSEVAVAHVIATGEQLRDMANEKLVPFPRRTTVRRDYGNTCNSSDQI